nr:MAG TPA: hypothetical protein [Bacteriophage sp.]
MFEVLMLSGFLIIADMLSMIGRRVVIEVIL